MSESPESRATSSHAAVASEHPPGSAAAVNRSGLPDGAAGFWSVALPRFLDPVAPALAAAIADGAWTAAWPALSLALPLVALAIGLGAPFVKGQMQYLFTESLLFLALAIGGAILSGPVGVMLLLGYAIGAPLARLSPSPLTGPLSGEAVTRYGASLLTADLLLAFATVVLPFAARGLLPARPQARGSASALVPVLRVVLFPVACAALAYLWCQAAPALLRPAFTFLATQPTPEVVRPLQQHWPALVIVAAAAAIARLLFEAVARRSRGGFIARLEVERQRTAAPGGLAALPSLLRLAAVAGIAALLLAGMYETAWGAILVAAAVIVVARVRTAMPGGWVRAVACMPALLRFAFATLAAYGLAYAVLAALWNQGSMRAALIATLLGWLPFALLFPRRRARAKTAARESVRTAAAGSEPP